MHGFDPGDGAPPRIRDTVKTAVLFDDFFGSIGWFFGPAALITLSLGGIGVLNAMSATAAERTPETRLKKALGAGRSRIMRSF